MNAAKISVIFLVAAIANLSFGCVTTKYDVTKKPYDEEYIYDRLLIRTGDTLYFDEAGGLYIPEKNAVCGFGLDSIYVVVPSEEITGISIRQSPETVLTTFGAVTTVLIASLFLAGFVGYYCCGGRPTGDTNE